MHLDLGACIFLGAVAAADVQVSTLFEFFLEVNLNCIYMCNAEFLKFGVLVGYNFYCDHLWSASSDV